MRLFKLPGFSETPSLKGNDEVCRGFFEGDYKAAKMWQFVRKAVKNA